MPFAYGVPAATKVFINDGKGKFRDETAARAPGFEQLGLVTTGLVTEVNGQQAVLLAGEWMAPQLYLIQEGKLQLDERQPFGDWSGWYFTASQADLSGNGRMDIVLGAQGLNSRLKPSTERPLVMVVNDFDQNGSVEQVFTYKEGSKHVPITLKHELERQLPYLKKRYLKYSAYNNQYLEDIFEPALLERSLYKEVQSFASIVLLQGEDGIFRVQPLPREAQKSRIFSVLIDDFNDDGIPDLLLGGNLYGVKPEMGKYDASFGELFLGKGDGTFDFVPNRVHGMRLEGDVRHLHWLPGDKRQLLVLRNQAPTQVWEQVKVVERGNP
ncbi:hypothetical protein A3SI_00781 [Nitritalea halalkaliphila LW7]|uniref:VCBS repeat-containing protein n=1 Tax=Nitritalea halalkaliphila LW7 TaxID=1189621 RepID=I5C9V4_9BACT|nr:hypothetical protein [Nitritalea halalkaliphila]EIM78606.1 hypothetical protein A3SI_00781 [Nitritalea halalkaliphila LW7]